MPVIAKTFAQLDADTIARLTSLGFTDAQYAGTPVRNIVESVDLHLSNLYDDLANNLLNYTLSQAQGSALDSLAFLLKVTRRAGENDTNLRYRITQANTVAQTANLMACLDALFALANISNVIAVPFTQGVGTITFYLIGTSGTVDPTTVALATTALQNIVAAGVYALVTTPTPVLLNLSGQLTLVPGAASATQVAAATAAVNTYIANLSMGNPFVVTQLYAAILNAGGGQISDFTLLTVSITNSTGTTQLLLANYTPAFNAQLLPGVVVIN